MSDPDPTTDILVVCTANIARSPLFAARLRWEADRREDLGEVTITSAGVETVYGLPASPYGVGVAEGWGADLSEHRSTPTSYVDLADPALIITMERAHNRAITEQEPAAAATTFTLPELLATLTERTDASALAALPAAGADPRGRLEAAVELAEEHRPSRLKRRRHEVADPIHGGQATFASLGERFEAEAATLADVLFGPA